MARNLARIVLLAAAAVVLVSIAGERAGAGGKGDQKIANELQRINIELAKANPVYAGHRGNAMNAIHDAVHQLGGTNVKKPMENQKKSMPQKKSDEILIHAVKQLSVVQQQLAKVANSASHANAANDLRYALSELEVALMTR
jgi:hypothetical protein